jgi:hypothetical protein
MSCPGRAQLNVQVLKTKNVHGCKQLLWDWSRWKTGPEGGVGGVLYDNKTGISGHCLDSVGGGGGADGSAGGVAVSHAAITVQAAGNPKCDVW